MLHNSACVYFRCNVGFHLARVMHFQMKQCQRLAQLRVYVESECLPVVLEGKVGHVVANSKDFAVLELMAFAAMSTANIDTSSPSAWLDVFTRPMSVGEVLEGSFEVLEILRENLIGRP